MEFKNYPALYRNADMSSQKCQRRYYRLLIVQYSLLFVASLSTLLSRLTTTQTASGIYLFCILIAAFAQLYSGLKGPEKYWYVARALAESVKTITWCYIMKVPPFDGSEGGMDADRHFSDYLTNLIEIHRDTSMALAYAIDHGSQITPEMKVLRGLSLNERIQLYRQERIESQYEWYKRKALLNKKHADQLSICCVAVYGVGIILSVFQFRAAGISLQGGAEPVLVIAAGLLGWMQAKRHAELASSYNLAAHEISKIRDNAEKITDADEFAVFVRESEMAFSREHTQWVARQSMSVF